MVRVRFVRSSYLAYFYLEYLQLVKVMLSGGQILKSLQFLKNYIYFASDVNSSKCLHAMSSKALFCTLYVDNLIYHIFSHGDVSISMLIRGKC